MINRKFKTLAIATLASIAAMSISTPSFAADTATSKNVSSLTLINKNDIASISKSNSYIKKATTLTNEMIKNEKLNISANKVKKAQDFSGNSYTVIECEPSGYYILHDKSGQYVEYSEESISPYSGYDGDLYYGGPMEYYTKSKGKYTNTLDKTTISSKADLNEFKELTKEIDSRLSKKTNTSVTEYLLGNVSSTSKFLNKKNQSSIQTTAAKSSAIAATYWASNSSIISRQNNNFGYINGGYCGYIASNILLRYWKSRGKIKFTYKNVTQLTKDLIAEGKKFGYGNATWGGSIANVINSYAKTKKFKAAAGSGVGANLAYREIKNNKRPSILFGNLKSPINNAKVKHAVVAYAVKVPKDTFNNFNTYVCHFGWNGYAKVNVSGGLIGSVTSYAP